MAARKLSPFELGYIVGLIEGEGHLRIFTGKTPSGRIRLTPEVGITNCDKKLLKKIQKIIGTGNIIVHSRETTKHNKIWRYDLRSYTEIKKLLGKILPHLITKKKRAMVLLKYVTEHEYYAHMTEDEWTLYNDLRILNTRGKKDLKRIPFTHLPPFERAKNLGHYNKKGAIPWNKGLNGEEYLSHYPDGIKNQHTASGG